MSAARRPLLTTAAASALLAALWFVPTSHATAAEAGTGPAAADRTAADAAPGAGPATLTASATSGGSGAHGPAAGTGGRDTTPYLVGGALILGLGAGFVSYSTRQGRAPAH